MKRHLWGLFFISLSTFAAQNPQLDSYSRFLSANKITLLSEDIQEADLREFMDEYKKFPQTLRTEMIKAGATINLLNGHSVTEDPSWPGEIKTFDGRSWSEVPGSGGAPFAQSPTRLVVNRLREGHGSVNLVLHEHGHAMDSTYKADGITNSPEWKAALESGQESRSTISQICGSNCLGTPREAFAELFAYYFDSESNRAHLTEAVPEIANFFKNLRSIKHLPSTQAVPSEEEVSEQPDVAMPIPQSRPEARPTRTQPNTETSHSSTVEETEESDDQDSSEEDLSEDESGPSKKDQFISTAKEVAVQAAHVGLVVLRFTGKYLGKGLEFVGEKMQEVSE